MLFTISEGYTHNMNPEKQSGVNPLEQFVLLAKCAKGAAAVELIRQCVEAPGVYVFGELLDMANIKEVYTLCVCMCVCCD